MSTDMVSSQPNPYDALAAQVIAGIEPEAQEELCQPFFATIMEQVETKPLATRKYTAAHFFVRHPEKFKMVAHYLARDVGVKRIAEMVGCSVHTVQAVRDRFPTSVATEKERLRRLCMQGSTLMVEQIIDNPERVPPQAWALAAAQLADKAVLLGGGPTVTVEHRHRFSHEDYNKLVDAAPIDIEAEQMGLEARESLQMGASPSAAAPASGDQGERPIAGKTDSESADLQRQDDGATRPATEQPPDPGGEGVPGNDGGAD